MMTITLYDRWLEGATKKIRVGGRLRPRMSKSQIKQILQLCLKADRSEFTPNGTKYYFK